MSEFRQSTALVAIAILFAACGEREVSSMDSEDIGPTKVTTTITGGNQAIDPTATPTSITPVKGSEPTITPSYGVSITDEFELVPDLQHLVWRAERIVRGRIVDELPPQLLPVQEGPLGAETPKQWFLEQVFTDYIMEVESTFRGVTTDTVTLRRMGGELNGIVVSNESMPSLHVGDEVVLFMDTPDANESGNGAWPLGGPQGVWWVRDGSVVPTVMAQYPTMSVSELAQTIADVLATEPPSDLTLQNGESLFIPITISPPGFDLPTPTVSVTSTP